MWCYRVVRQRQADKTFSYAFCPALHEKGKVTEVNLAAPALAAQSPLDLEQALQDAAEALIMPTLEWDGKGSWLEIPSYMEMANAPVVSSR